MTGNKEFREELIRQIREAGESLIKNAESIVGNEKYLTDVCVKVFVSNSEQPRILVEREFLSEKTVERLS